MLFGASYYHEYQPYERLDADLDLMVAAGFTVIRVGESTWASYEPVEGEISFDALRRVVEAVSDRGLKIIMGTPSYAIPPWMARKYPEVMAVRAEDGQRIAYGARQNIDFTNSDYLRQLERVIRLQAATFASMPAVIGFQVDNEIGVTSIANAAVVERFRDHVAEKFGTVDAVNHAWGLDYWSHRLGSFDDLWAPAGNTNPGYALEWRRFQALLTHEFLAWQKDILREYTRPDQVILHDLVGGHSLANTSPRLIAQLMDHNAVNVYAPFQRGLELPEPHPEELAALAPYGPEDADAEAWFPLWKADMAYSMKGPHGERFFVTETQASSIGDSHNHVTPWPGQLRLFALEQASRGADLLAYWHWHTLHYGNETYWGGVIGHDLEPGRIYSEVAKLGASLKILRPYFDAAIPDAEVTFLYSWESNRALTTKPALANADGSPDQFTYHRIFTRFYQGATDKRLQVRVAHPDSEIDDAKMIIVPALYISSEELLQRLIQAARAGAHVVFTFRSAYANEWAQVRPVRQPALIADVLGASYQEYTSLFGPVGIAEPGFPITGDATATAWADGLVVDDATELGRYDHPFLNRFAAAATREVGAGRITWIGTLPDRTTAAEIVAWAAEERGIAAVAAAWADAPDTVRVTSSLRPNGERIWTVANHSWKPAELTTPADAVLYEPDGQGPTGPSIALGPWESRVFVQSEAKHDA